MVSGCVDSSGQVLPLFLPRSIFSIPGCVFELKLIENSLGWESELRQSTSDIKRIRRSTRGGSRIVRRDPSPTRMMNGITNTRIDISGSRGRLRAQFQKRLP